MGGYAIEGTTWDIFFGRITEPIFVSLEDGFTRKNQDRLVFVDSREFSHEGITEHEFRGEIKRFIVKNDIAHGNIEVVRFIPNENKTVVVELFHTF